MMDEMTKIKFARAIVRKDKASELPDFYADFFDAVTRRSGELIAQTSGPPKTDWPIVAACAEYFHRLEERIVALEARVRPVMPTTTAAHESVHVDMRTKEGRAMKLQTVGA